jgi:flagellar hook-associated protein 2
VQLVLSSRRSGTDGGLVFDHSAAPATLATETELYAGRDALLTMGSGAEALEISSPTNRLTNLINGVTVDLKKTTTEPVTVEAQRDTAVTVEKVRALVDALNGAISTLKSNTAYDAATGSRGKLQGDSTATGLRFALSGALSMAVKGLTGKFTSGSTVGIGVGRDGLITLDADALSEALAEDNEAVLKMFTAPAKPEPGQPGPGLFPNLDTVLKQYEGTKGRIASARKGLTDRIAAYDDQIERYEVQVALRERMLRTKWSGLENSLSVIQSQSSMLTSALGLAG